MSKARIVRPKDIEVWRLRNKSKATKTESLLLIKPPHPLVTGYKVLLQQLPRIWYSEVRSEGIHAKEILMEKHTKYQGSVES